jgi:hypothetical protein
MKGAIFLHSEVDMMLINVDDIVYVRALDEQDLDPRSGQLRSGIHADAVTELRLRDGGTHYLREPLELFVERIQNAIEVIARG